jgi:hypothetical protein
MLSTKTHGGWFISVEDRPQNGPVALIHDELKLIHEIRNFLSWCTAQNLATYFAEPLPTALSAVTPHEGPEFFLWNQKWRRHDRTGSR